MKTNKSKQVKESDFGFRMKQYMQCVTTIYLAIYIIYKLGNFL